MRRGHVNHDVQCQQGGKGRQCEASAQTALPTLYLLLVSPLRLFPLICANMHACFCADMNASRSSAAASGRATAKVPGGSDTGVGVPPLFAPFLTGWAAPQEKLQRVSPADRSRDVSPVSLVDRLGGAVRAHGHQVEEVRSHFECSAYPTRNPTTELTRLIQGSFRLSNAIQPDRPATEMSSFSPTAPM